jgi:hypothetical protein
MNRITVICALLLLFLVLPSRAQKNETDSATSIPMFYGFYGYQWPGADMAAQFGSNSVIGPGFALKTRSNWIYGAEYDFMFGNNVKNGLDILKYMLNSEGDVISGDGTPAVVALFERAYTVSAKFGKLFPVLRSDKNSGLFVTAGIGFMSHKVRIEVENNSAPQLKGDYKRGYDRLSGGLMLNQAIGFMYFGKNRLMNFTLSVEVVESWTKSYRDYYFDLMSPPPEGQQFNVLIGPKIAWMLPLRQRNVNKVYYY